MAKATAVDRLMELQEQEVQVHDEGDDENKKARHAHPSNKMLTSLLSHDN